MLSECRTILINVCFGEKLLSWNKDIYFLSLIECFRGCIIKDGMFNVWEMGSKRDMALESTCFRYCEDYSVLEINK